MTEQIAGLGQLEIERPGDVAATTRTGRNHLQTVSGNDTENIEICKGSEGESIAEMLASPEDPEDGECKTLYLVQGDAKKYGDRAAYILQFIRYSISCNRSIGRNLYDGRTWVYHTAKQFKEKYPWLSEKKVRTALNKLVAAGVLIARDDLNESPYDTTKWYAFVDEKAQSSLPNGKSPTSQTGTLHSINKELSIRRKIMSHENATGLLSRIQEEQV
jgi:hypothetical protein